MPLEPLKKGSFFNFILYYIIILFIYFHAFREKVPFLPVFFDMKIVKQLL